MFSNKISRWSLLFLLVGSCSTKEQVKEKLPVKQKAITTFEEQEVEPMKKVKKPSKRIYESYIFKKLSNSFDFRIRFNYEEDNFLRINVPWNIVIIKKSDSLSFQKIESQTNLQCSLFGWDNVRSYETHLNINREIIDENAGYLIVGDFNFDSLSDFCILNNVPVSGTPSYNFFLQKSDSVFVFNKTFTDEIRFAPQKLNPKSRTFDVNSHSGCCFLDFKTFRIDKNGRIKLIRHKKNENGKTIVIL